MFKLGIKSVHAALACPGARRIVLVKMIDGAFGLFYPNGKIEWVPADGKGLFDER